MTQVQSSNHKTVLIVGTGLIGTSIGMGLTALGERVWLTDADPDAVEVAVERGAGKAAVIGGQELDPSIIFVAVPPLKAAEVINCTLSTYLNATVSDVTSTKAKLLQEVEALGGDLSRFVPGHPMAGRELSGPGAARADLFADRMWALTPTAATDPDRRDEVAEVVRGLGSTVVITSAQEHDRAVALTSHTPQVVASLVAAGLAPLDDTGVSLSGQGLRDVTRLAASDAELWSEILASNSGPVTESLTGLIDRLTVMRNALLAEPPDRGVLASSLRAGAQGYAKVPGKHGSASTKYAIVPVVVADQPGELGRLFASVGAAGVNLEDVRIEHSQGRPTGLVELEVQPASADLLAEALRARGWEVRF
jgi:prephenate dehydrogenase